MMKRVRKESGTSEDFEEGLRDAIGVTEFETSCLKEACWGEMDESEAVVRGIGVDRASFRELQ